MLSMMVAGPLNGTSLPIRGAYKKAICVLQCLNNYRLNLCVADIVLVCLVLVNVFTNILQALMKNIICGKEYGEIGKLAEIPDSAKYHIVG